MGLLISNDIVKFFVNLYQSSEIFDGCWFFDSCWEFNEF